MSKSEPAKSYRELEEELQIVLNRVEHDSYDELDDLLKDYDKGSALIAQLQKKLETAKNSIKKASKTI